MMCIHNIENETVETYLLDRASESEQERFEQHLLSCNACQEKLEIHLLLKQALLPALQPSLPASPPAPMWAWAVAAAAIVILSGLALIPDGTAPVSPPAPPEAIAKLEKTSPAAPSENPAETLQPKSPESRGTAPETPPPSLSLAQLARVEPPPYIPIRLRGNASQVSEQFTGAMEHYLQGDYVKAIPGLRSAVQLESESVQYRFYLGASLLLANDPDSAAKEFQEIIRQGSSPYLEEAHFYLAKASLQMGDTSSAQHHLKLAREQQGRLEEQIEGLLRQLRQLNP